MDIKPVTILHNGCYRLHLLSAAVHTQSHGSCLMTDFSDAGTCVKAQTELACFSLQRIGTGNLTLLRAKAMLGSMEDRTGNLITLSAENGLELSMCLSQEKSETGDPSLMAISQHKPWWMRPYFAKDLENIPARTQLVIGRGSRHGLFWVMMALCSDRTRTDLEGKKDGIRITVSSNRNNETALDEPFFAFAEGPDPYDLITRIYKELREQRNFSFKLREEKAFPQVFRGLGWCTWDSLGHDVTEEAIFRKMEELQEKQVPVKWVLIDDGWSWVDPKHQKLKSFRADPVKFPKGLSHTVRRLKEDYGVEAVGVWQAFKGYWRGIADDFEDWQLVGSYLQRYGNGDISVKPEASAAFGFWDSWHSILEKDGIDFVKIDGQSSMQILQKGMISYGEGMQALYKGMEASVFLHFGGNVMNCMGMAPENAMNRSVSALSRTSDDYLPTIQGSFYEHALQNAYNNVYQGPLYYGDWDMFWSEHEDASRGMLLRMISGGPVYLSDGCGHTDPDLISRIIGSDGKLNMCDDIGRPTLDCLTRDPFKTSKDGMGGILKIYNRRGGKIVIACFCAETEGRTLIVPSDIAGIGQKQVQIYNTKTETGELCSQEHPYELRMNAREEVILELTPEK